MKRMPPEDVARLDTVNQAFTSRMGELGIPLNWDTIMGRIQDMSPQVQSRVLKVLGNDEGAIPPEEIHPTWRYNGTTHGRWMCRNPNILSLPLETWDADSLIHPMGVVGLEFRVAVTLAGEEELLSMCAQGVDIHAEVGALLGVPRRIAKALNYGLVLKAPLDTMAKVAQIPIEDLTGPIAQWHARYPKFTAYADKMAMVSIRGELAETAILGVRHCVEGPNNRALTYMTIGTAADVMKIAFRQLWDHGIQVRGVLHDTFLVDSPNVEQGQMILEEVLQEWLTPNNPSCGTRRTAWEFLLDE